MFRDVYKQANEDIKGDRSIIDNAFLQAAQPKKEKRGFVKYSVVGTAVAAAFVIGALFLNSNLFTNKVSDLNFEDERVGKKEDEKNETATVSDTNAAVARSVSENNAVETGASSERKVKVSSRAKGAVAENVPRAVKEDEASEDDEGLAVGFSLRGELMGAAQQVCVEGENDEGLTEVEYENESEETMIFSYMYDLNNSVGVTDNFKNTDACEIKGEEDAIKRAENEYDGEYEAAEVYRDKMEDIWKVVFEKSGEKISVYMNSEGITVFEVHGE